MPPSKPSPNGGTSAAWVSWQTYTDGRLSALEKQADALEQARELRLAAECKALDARFAILDARLSAMDRALTVASEAGERRWENSNEFRGSLDDAVQTLKSVTTLMPSRSEFNMLRERVDTMLVTLPQHDALASRIDGIEGWKDKQEGKASQSSVIWFGLLAAGGFVLALVTFIIERVTP
jgi:hypothetical protein